MIPVGQCMARLIIRRPNLFTSTSLTRALISNSHFLEAKRGKKSSSKTNNGVSLFEPVPVQSNPNDDNVGVELTGALDKTYVSNIVNIFCVKKEIDLLCSENGLDEVLRRQAYVSFRRYCLETNSLPVDLHVTLSDIIQGAGNVVDIFPYFMRHARKMFPHLECIDELKKISDLRSPANWYPLARSKIRRIIYHAGPTNSGKTYHALKRFMNSKSGVYCGPLKLLAFEVFQKCKTTNTPCDLITGEERIYVSPDQKTSSHVSCTIEMVNLNEMYEVAVIDEIQMIKDYGRGWAWTRAILGIAAEEIHICGESSAIELIKLLCLTTGEDVEINHYERLTNLTIEDKPLESLDNVLPGDCVVCFNKNDIYTATRYLEKRGKEVAVIYGSLPPNTKSAQAAKFNDPDHPCKILVATDAIGMGLNLHIRRVIFYSLMRPNINDSGEREMETISVSSALQIAGRAGRFGTQWQEGFVTTMRRSDLPTLKKLLSQTPETLTKAGLHPTADQIELYAYHLPKAALSNLMDIFVSLCTVDNSLYFMCQVDDFKFLADMIQHVPLPLRVRYVFCCSPINKKVPFICTMFLKFARQYSKNDVITYSWLYEQIGWPVAVPKTIIDLVHLESVFDVLDLYQWLSYRFPDLFPDAEIVKRMQSELEIVIQNGIVQLTSLLKFSDSERNIVPSEADNLELKSRKQTYFSGSQLNNTESKTGGRGRLTDKLLAQGLLTPNMLMELHREWTEGQSASQKNDENVGLKRTRKPK